MNHELVGRYVFPGVCLAALTAGAHSICKQDFILAAQVLAAQVPAERVTQGSAFPALDRIRDASLEIAVAVAEQILKDDRGSVELSAELTNKEAIRERCECHFYEPTYDY